MSLLKPFVNENDNQLGHPDLKLTLVEYGDYQCPYCGMAHPSVKRLLEEKGDVIRFVFRNFPLQTIHAEALHAALAAEAAALQDQFWPMHDLLFENQERFGKALFPTLADQLGLDAARFQRDVASDAIRGKVEGRSDWRGLRYDALLRAVEESLDVVT